MAYFSGKQVTETVSCKDAVSGDPTFHDVIFTAYYEGLPHIDISVGALVSLLGGRQVGALSPPLSATAQAACQNNSASGCTNGTILGDTSRNSYQFMPAVVVEWRWKNFVPPWVRNGSPIHKLGYLWSIGPAAGIAINPNNGSTEAEFFQGLSLGIQRFSILFGVHEGRYQEFGGGYTAGEMVPAGTSPPIVHNWAVHPAFGIAYRIPIR